MNVENATSDDSVAVDDDLVAALGFEPANDLLIIDDAFGDDLSISTDDIEVSPTTDEVNNKSDRRVSSGSKSVSKEEAKPKAESPKTESKTDSDSKVDAESESKLEKKSETKVAKPPKPEHRGSKAKSPVKDAVVEKPQGDRASADSSDQSQAEIPPPKAEHAVLLAPTSVPNYSFRDIKLPDVKAAFARFTRTEEKTAVADADLAQTVQTAPTAETKTATSPPVLDAPPIIVADPIPEAQPQIVQPEIVQPEVVQPQIVQAPLEPNVHIAPTRGGRTRIRSRKVRRQIRHIDPWSVLTFSFIFHLCFFGALFLASVLVWRFADGAGMIENVEKLWGELAQKEDFDIDEEALGRAAFMIAGLLTIASSVMLVLLTVFFNLISDLVGGIRVTVIEEEPVRTTK